MEYQLAAALGLAFFIYSVSFRRLARAELTGPMYFVIVGAALAWAFSDAMKVDQPLSALLPLVELTLAVFLFTDAAKTRINVLKSQFKYPLVLLFVALPVTFFATFALGYLLFPHMHIIALALLAIILTPTDAALSKGLLESQSVPEKIRESINVESGLNDGMCVPIFLFLFLSWQHGEFQGAATMLTFLIEEIGIALIVGVTVTYGALKLTQVSATRHYFEKSSSPFLVLSVAVSVFTLAQLLGGSGFVAAFVGGLVFDKFYRADDDEKLIEDSEHIADFFAYLIWCLFGAYAFIQLQTIDLNIYKVLFAFLAATLVRVVPVMLSLIPFNKLSLKEKFTLAWFGPRGLASIVFTLMVLESTENGLTELATLTILMSVFIHGITTRPIANSYKNRN